MRVNYINNETRDFLGAQQNHVCYKKLKRLRKQRIAPLMLLCAAYELLVALNRLYHLAFSTINTYLQSFNFSESVNIKRQ